MHRGHVCEAVLAIDVNRVTDAEGFFGQGYRDPTQTPQSVLKSHLNTTKTVKRVRVGASFDFRGLEGETWVLKTVDICADCGKGLSLRVVCDLADCWCRTGLGQLHQFPALARSFAADIQAQVKASTLPLMLTLSA